jgi:EAL domain-containing protein (putative c-di-GMP-specific phosphodiesterase class I)
VLSEACDQVAAWQQDPLRAGDPLWLAVNVSPRQLDDPGLVDAVAAALRDSDLAEGTLALELTESALMVVDGHGVVLDRLREAGARPVPGRLRHRLLLAHPPDAAARSPL